MWGLVIAFLIALAIVVVIVLPASVAHAAGTGIHRGYSRARGTVSAALAQRERRGDVLSPAQKATLDGHVKRHPSGSVARYRAGSGSRVKSNPPGVL